MLTHELVGRAMQEAMNLGRLHMGLAALQEEKLRRLLKHAAAKSPFYAKLYAGLDLDTIPLAELPITNKAAIQANFNDAVTDARLTRDDLQAFCQEGAPRKSPWLKDSFAVMLSSGTSGNRGYFTMDGHALAAAIAMGFRQSEGRKGRGEGRGTRDEQKKVRDEGRGARGEEQEARSSTLDTQSSSQPSTLDPRPSPPRQRIAAVMLIEPFDAAGLLMRLIPDTVGEKRLIDNRQELAAICEQLNEFQPTLLSSFPYSLRMLAEAQRQGKLHISPHRITSSGDVLTAGDRAAIRDAFGIEPFDYYCCTEATYLAWECDAHEGLHVNADYVLLESVDENNRPVPPGVLGEKILITNLANDLLPLIRYEIRDQVEYMAAPCSCGFPLPRIRTVAGRMEHVLKLAGAHGQRVPLIPEQIDHYLGPLPVIYQVIQETSTQLTLNYIPQPDTPAEIAMQLREGLAACFARYGVSSEVQVDVRQVARFEPIRPGGSKTCLYWNRSA